MPVEKRAHLPFESALHSCIKIAWPYAESALASMRNRLPLLNSRSFLRRRRTFRARGFRRAICTILFTALVSGPAANAEVLAGFGPAAALASIDAPATRPGHSPGESWYLTSVFRTSCSLFLVAGVLSLLYRRSTRHVAPIEVPDIPSPAPPALAPTDVDLQLLRQLGDATAGGLAREIERFVEAFDADRKLAHLIAANGDHKQIHQIGHRLLGHSCAVHYEPLIELAGKLQSQAALLDSTELDELMREFDRRFATLRNKLGALRASTARA